MPGHIPPGGGEKIIIEVDTADCGGTYIKKHITVITDDPKGPELELTISGNVKKRVDIQQEKRALKKPEVEKKDGNGKGPGE